MGNLAKRLDFEELDLQESLYKKFSEKLYGLTGINLPYNQKNVALVKNRLSKVIRRNNWNSYEDYWRRLCENNSEAKNTAMLDEFISALTTNKTHFFREDAHFEFTKKWLQKNYNPNQELRVWCAAASTGQEPWTIVMTLLDAFPNLSHGRCKVLATDIDLKVLARAAEGIYSESEVESMPEAYLKKYFEMIEVKKEKCYRVSDHLSGFVRYAPLNLIEESYPFQHKFDLIYCRNVLIYFDPPTIAKVIGRLVQNLKKNGILFLGHSESGNVKHPELNALISAVYQKK